MSADRIRPLLDAVAEHWAGQTVALVVDHFNGGMKALAEELTRCGATIAAVVSNAAPAGGDPAVPLRWSAEEHGLRLSHHQFENWLAGHPTEVLDWLDTHDPTRQWQILGTTYATFAELGGRPAVGRWRPDWAVWEDKTRVDALWQRAGVPAPPHEIRPVDDPDLPAVVARLDRGRGVILAADATRSVLGSSQGLRWVRTDAELADARARFAGTCDRLRISPFLPGVPNSILGMVLPDGVAVFDPFEIITLRRPDTGQLIYGGTSTWWRPGERDREQIRHHTRKVGEELAASAGYVGIYSVDGLLGPDGFLATELNPRHVSGLGLRAGWPEFPIRLLNRAIQQGSPALPAFDHRDLEMAVRDAVRANPSCSLWVPLTDDVPSTSEQTTQTLGRTVRFSVACGGFWLLGGELAAGDGTIGPVAAELAAALGSADLVSFADDSVTSTLLTSAR